MKDFWTVFSIVSGAAVALILAGLLTGAINLAAMPWVAHQQTEINRNSQGYVETKQNLIMSLTFDGFKLEREIKEARDAGRNVDGKNGELIATLDRIESECNLLPDKTYIPPQARDLLARYGRYV